MKRHGGNLFKADRPLLPERSATDQEEHEKGCGQTESEMQEL
jgi:hypothetical protein